MITGNENNSSQDKRGLFTRFLNPLWQGITNKASIHNGVLGSISKELESTLSDMVDSKRESWLDTADGVFLNHWGEFVGVYRRVAEDDEEYRARIKKYITVLRGTIPAIKDALYDYFGDYEANINIYEPHVDIFYTNKSLLNGKDHLQGEYYRYAVIDVSIDRAFNYDEVMSIIDKFKPAGVMVIITHNPSLNINVGVVDGFYWALEVQSLITEVQSFTGYKANFRRLLGLSTSSVMTDKDLFILNYSDLNSTDVLSGSSTQGRTSLHGVFTAPDISPTTDNTVIEMLSQGAEVDPMIYTATGFSGGARVPVELLSGEYLYQAIDVFEYHYLTSEDKYTNKKFKFIKVSIDDSPIGMDLGYLTALNKEGVDVATDAKWSVSVHGNSYFDVYDNGENITNPLDRVSYATLVLDVPSELTSIQIDNSYGSTSSNGGIYVSEDGEEYYNVYYGELSNSTYEVKDYTSATTSSEGYNKYLSSVYSDLSVLLYLRTSGDDNTTTLEVMNFSTGSWEVLSVKEGYIVNFEEKVTTNIHDYVSKKGVILTRVSTDTSQEIQVDFSTISLNYHRGFRYLLDLSIQASISRVTLVAEADKLTLEVPQTYSEGQLSLEGKYYTPFRKARLEIENTNTDPNAGTYFKISELERYTGSSVLEGFDAGKLLGENSSGEATEVLAVVSRIGKEDTVIKLDVSGDYATLDLGGWALDVTSITFQGGAYRILNIYVNNYREPSNMYVRANPLGSNMYILGEDYFKWYYPLSKVPNGESKEDYINNPNLFITAKSENEHYKTCSSYMTVVGDGTGNNEREPTSTDRFGLSINTVSTLDGDTYYVDGRTNTGVRSVSIHSEGALLGTFSTYNDNNRFHAVLQGLQVGSPIAISLADADKEDSDIIETTIKYPSTVRIYDLKVDPNKFVISGKVKGDINISDVRLTVNNRVLTLIPVIDGEFRIIRRQVYELDQVTPKDLGEGDIVRVEIYSSVPNRHVEAITRVGFDMF